MNGPVDVLAVLDETADWLYRSSEGRGDDERSENVKAARAAVAELIEAAKEYRKQYGWQGNPWQERAAIKLDDALAAIGSAA